ncbi:hypothetical protein WM40_19055 [Robbsia andropogonis]|uniref:Uncharacterized protein n=1 Tax=Robbsia andropogonis TaxID=28092 RepID=A0A0F5JWB6_9BURK|nr:hypothetical protein WM40_19055 [Robbsia andropogonis]
MRLPCCNLVIDKTIYFVIVDDTAGLHEGVNDCRTDKFEATLLQRLGNGLGKRGGNVSGDAISAQNLAVGKRPDEIGELLTVFLHFAINACAVDGRLYLCP